MQMIAVFKIYNIIILLNLLLSNNKLWKCITFKILTIIKIWKYIKHYVYGYYLVSGRNNFFNSILNYLLHKLLTKHK